MVKIMADTSTLYTPEQAKAQGFTVVPLSVALNGTTYRDLEEINGKAFCDKVRGDTAHHPISSQPNVADLKAAYEALAPDDVLNITMADGLSGTYGTAVGVKSMLSEPERITVLNSRTLCGPHRYLVDKAVQLAALGQSVKQILAGIRESLDSTRSFLIPQDLGFLQRGGRLMPLAAHIGELLHLIPVMVQTSDGKRINRFSVTRTFSRAMKDVAANLCKQGVNEKYMIYISDADNGDWARQAHEVLRSLFPTVQIERFALSPAFVTQGGPGCVAIQTILK